MALTRGRPTKYDPIYCEEIVKFFSKKPYKKVFVGQDRIVKKVGGRMKTTYRNKYKYEATDFPTIEGFAVKIGVDTDTIANWANERNDKKELIHPEFFGAYKEAKALQKNLWQIGSMLGIYNPAFTIFLGKNVFDWKDKTETDLTSKGKSIVVKRIVP